MDGWFKGLQLTAALLWRCTGGRTVPAALAVAGRWRDAAPAMPPAGVATTPTPRTVVLFIVPAHLGEAKRATTVERVGRAPHSRWLLHCCRLLLW